MTTNQSPAPLVIPHGEFARPGMRPAGWAVEQLGSRGPMVMFDPQRHQLSHFLYPPSSGLAERLRADGWSMLAGTNGGELWARDRLVEARRALDRPARSVEPVGLSL